MCVGCTPWRHPGPHTGACSGWFSKEGASKSLGGKTLLNPWICYNRTPVSARRLQNEVMWSAEQHNVNSTTVNLGRPDVPGQNFAGPPDGATDVNIRSA